MDLEEQIEFTRELIAEFERVDMRMKAHSNYDSTYFETSEKLEYVLESLERLQDTDRL
jgi:hypothetical protein